MLKRETEVEEKKEGREGGNPSWFWSETTSSISISATSRKTPIKLWDFSEAHQLLCLAKRSMLLVVQDCFGDQRRLIPEHENR